MKPKWKNLPFVLIRILLMIPLVMMMIPLATISRIGLYADILYDLIDDNIPSL